MRKITFAHDTFKKYCSLRQNAQGNFNAIRKLWLYQTQGLGPINKLVDANTGCVLSKDAVCQNNDLFIVTTSPYMNKDMVWFAWLDKMDQHIHNLMREESRLMRQGQQLRFQHFIASHRAQNVAALRLEIMTSRSPAFNVRAIHFFRWDGSCRCSPKEIFMAMNLYRPTMTDMAAFWEVALGPDADAVTRDMRALFFTERDEKTGSYTPLISKGRCRGSEITIIGEEHSKRLFGNFLRYAFDRILELKDAVILLEWKPYIIRSSFLRSPRSINILRAHVAILPGAPSRRSRIRSWVGDTLSQASLRE
jgi:hypothetical protein